METLAELGGCLAYGGLVLLLMYIYGGIRYLHGLHRKRQRTAKYHASILKAEQERFHS